MPIRQTTPTEALEALRSDPEVIYLDVRTPDEFSEGHPEGAWNIPLVFLDPAGGPARPNEEFLPVVQRHLPTAATILVGCLSGGRSQRACAILAAAGYTSLANVQGGFGGARDRSGGVVVAGWRDSGLPVADGQPQGRAYTDLANKA